MGNNSSHCQQQNSLIDSYRILFEKINLGISVVDIFDYEDVFIVSANPGFARLWEVPLSSVVGKRMIEDVGVLPSEAHDTLELLRECERTGSVHKVLCRTIPKTGVQKWISYSAYFIGYVDYPYDNTKTEPQDCSPFCSTYTIFKHPVAANNKVNNNDNSNSNKRDNHSNNNSDHNHNHSSNNNMPNGSQYIQNNNIENDGISNENQHVSREDLKKPRISNVSEDSLKKRIPRFSITVEDITNRKKVEEELETTKILSKALQRSENRYRQLVESLPMTFWVTDSMGDPSFINKKGIQYMQGIDTVIDPEIWHSLIHPEDLSKVTAARTNAAQENRDFTVEVRLRRHDGVYRWHMMNAMPLIEEIESDDFDNYWGSLTTSQANLSASASGEHIGMKDSINSLEPLENSIKLMKGNSNPGLGMSSILSNSFLDLTSLGGPVAVASPDFSKVLKSMSSRGFDFDNSFSGIGVTASGKFGLPNSPPSPVHPPPRYSNPDLHDTGNKSPVRVTQWYGVQVDIHDRKELDELNKTDQAKSRFLATMSHEMRTPLSVIIGMATFLSKTPLNTEQLEMLQNISLCSEQLLILINNLLDIFKLEENKVSLEQVPFPVQTCLEEIMEQVSNEVCKKNIELIMDVESDVPPVITIDVNRLRQIVINLLGNAIKFSPEGSEVILRAEMMRETSPHPPEWTNPKKLPKLSSRSHIDIGNKHLVQLCFSVVDKGVGIPDDGKSKLFQLFGQYDTSTTRKYGGGGLGLAISRKLVELMGGRIWFESEVGKGSTFYFTIQAARQETMPPSHYLTDTVGASICSLYASTHTVILLIDQKSQLRVMKRTVTQWNFNVICFETIEEVIDFVRLNVIQGVAPHRCVNADCHQPSNCLQNVVTPRGTGRKEKESLKPEEATWFSWCTVITDNELCFKEILDLAGDQVNKIFLGFQLPIFVPWPPSLSVALLHKPLRESHLRDALKFYSSPISHEQLLEQENANFNNSMAINPNNANNVIISKIINDIKDSISLNISAMNNKNNNSNNNDNINNAQSNHDICANNGSNKIGNNNNGHSGAIGSVSVSNASVEEEIIPSSRRGSLSYENAGGSSGSNLIYAGYTHSRNDSSDSTNGSTTPPLSQRRGSGGGSSRRGSLDETLLPCGVRYPLRILVVDDNAMTRKVAVKMLNGMGYNKVGTASDGKEAVSAAAQKESNPEPDYDVSDDPTLSPPNSPRLLYDCILMDMEMPVMDGCEASELIRKEEFGPHIIAMTANHFPEDRERCLAAGMCNYMSKPIRKEHLERELVHAWLVKNESEPCRCSKNTPRDVGERLHVPHPYETIPEGEE
eukprot:TRINITY_DN4160_c0_g1_i1.p1 TRINITY_DN4160_c0_g1~~TRINITY_DN4160_c0_g1_i1.p1  ORF type:complete len:1325 (+),score=281.82 TRINITY_DN4160_c0_g1_i1:2133-6107(+)